jgi:hypothetical protein
MRRRINRTDHGGCKDSIQQKAGHYEIESFGNPYITAVKLVL